MPKSTATLFALVLFLVLGAFTNSAWAITCAEVPAGSLVDTDGDGLTDVEECAVGGITTFGTTTVPPLTFLPCTSDMARESCLDVNSKDLFVVFRPAPNGSLLVGNPALPINTAGTPALFAPLLEFPCLDKTNDICDSAGFRFEAFKALGITTHQLRPEHVGVPVGRDSSKDRLISPRPGFTQKAIRVTESLDTSSTTVLGYCTWGTPRGLDGCTIYTARVRNFINSKCDAAGDLLTDRNLVLVVYSTFLALHEAGHTLGGLATTHDSAVGGYHYASTSGKIMSQAAEYSVDGGRCRFFIPSAWNPTLELPGLKFK